METCTDCFAEMVKEVREKLILHWNYRGFTHLPEVIRNYGSHIQEIYLKWNQLTSLPPWTAELSNITNLYLHGNQIEKLPDDFGEMVQLSTLDLSQNRLQILPTCIGKLEKLKVFILNDNLIRTLPPEMSQLNALETLSVSGNKLVALPEWLGSLPNLQELVADRNLLQELPNRLTIAPRLSAISVCSNRLRYLPLNGFMSAPCIRFDYNPALVYLSVPVWYQVTIRNKICIEHDVPAYGCFDVVLKENTFESNANIRLRVNGWNSLGDPAIVIELPRQLLTVYKVCEYKVPSLWELALRQLYICRFEHTLDLNVAPMDVKVSYRPTTKGENLGSTGYMENLIKNGPTSICVNPCCQKPIFTEAWITLGARLVNSSRPIFAIALFCSRWCAHECDMYPEVAMDLEWQIVQ